VLHSRPFLFVGFAFAVMADPVSSVAYAIEAALRARDGRLDLLLPTMALVIGIVALVVANYWFLVARFPEGGGDAGAAGHAFGDAWGFPPMGALIVDFALTIAISVAAATSAIVAYVPGLASFRLPLALALTGLLAMARFSFGERRRALLVVNCVAVVAVTFTLAVNLGRGYPIASLAAALAIAGALHRLWVRAGRPSGIARAELEAEASASL
jgi:hypothetical protein